MNTSLEKKGMELLAPAGSFEAFKAAVENGADAVYLGGKSFNARAGAANFDLEELRQAVKYAHERNVKVYVTVNILIADQEFPELIDYLYALYEIGVDAVILQDIGVAELLQSILPEIERHASTQMTVNTSWGVRHIESLGFKRVVLARETSAREMKEISKRTDLEIEVFVHGALCVCYSGQCLMSSFIGGRSGNRGTCAQPCRLTYQLVNEKREDVLAEANVGEHLLSPRDLNLIDELKELKESGVYSLKVEGRMKRPEYVATVIRIYRHALDLAFKGAQEQISDEERLELMQIFNRDFTIGYFKGHPGVELMSYSRPNNRGIRLGRVTKLEKNRLSIKLEAPLRPGDGIEVWTGRGREGITVGRILGASGEIPEGQPGQIVQVDFTGQARPGDRVFKTHDERLMEKTRLSFQEGKEQRKRPLKMRLSGRVGEKLLLEVWDGKNKAIAVSTNVAQQAFKRPLTHDYVFNQLGRLGGTPFWLNELELHLEGEIMLPVSDLNEMRRSAVEELLREKLVRPEVSRSLYRRRIEEWQAKLHREKKALNSATTAARLSVAVSDLDGVKAALQGGARRILMGGERWRSRHSLSLEDLQAGIELCEKYGAESVWRLPRILNEGQSTRWFKELEKVSQWNRRPIVMVSNLGELEILREIDQSWPFETDFSLNVFNEASLAHFLRSGARVVTLSPELENGQIERLAGWPGTELLVFGDLEMMVSEYCPVGATLGGKKGEKCSGPCVKEPYFLRDRMKYDFPIETDVDCRMHLFNAKRLNLYKELWQIAKMGVKNIRLQLTRADYRQIRETVSLFAQGWENALSGKKIAEDEVEEAVQILESLFPEGFTKGHFFRGVI